MWTLLVAVLAVAGVAVQSASADEVWESEFGLVVYEDEVGPFAVWSFPPGENYPAGKVFLAGLAGNYDDRGSHDGYWMTYGGGEVNCGEPLVDAFGDSSPYWGNITVTFDTSGWPSSWTAEWSYCNDRQTYSWRGVPPQ